MQSFDILRGFRHRADLEANIRRLVVAEGMLRLMHHLLDAAGADRPFERNPLLARPAQQRMNGNAQGASQQVVQRHIEHRQGGGVRRQLARHLAQQRRTMKRISPNGQWRVVIAQCGDGARRRVSLERIYRADLSPARDAASPHRDQHRTAHHSRFAILDRSCRQYAPKAWQ